MAAALTPQETLDMAEAVKAPDMEARAAAEAAQKAMDDADVASLPDAEVAALSRAKAAADAQGGGDRRGAQELPRVDAGAGGCRAGPAVPAGADHAHDPVGEEGQMTFPNAEKKRLVDGDGITDRALYVALGIGTTELTGHGYSRGMKRGGHEHVGCGNGVVTIASGQEIYTPDDASAQDSTHMRIARSAAGVDWVTDWVAHNDIDAPANNQAVNTGTVTITP